MKKSWMKVLLIITIILALYIIVTKTIGNTGYFNLVKNINYYINNS